MRLAILGRPVRSRPGHLIERVVANAVALNPIVHLIPYHGIIRDTGLLSGNLRGAIRKAAMQGWEDAKTARAV